ncbi:YceI family protein [Parvularcula marina]|uniref:YceI family protein n=1 Tax=Parvularcula marina TaxID=2292771 RepID=UPI003517B800
MIRFTAPILGAALLLSAASAQETPDISSISSGKYVMDPDHGYVTISYSHFGYSNPILRFDTVEAVVELDTENPSSSTLMVDIDPASIDSGIEKFDNHLKSGDMFDVAAYPEITFTSSAIDLDAGTLTGNLTIKGVTKPVTLDVVLNGAGEHPFSGEDHFGVSATGKLDRTEWGVNYLAPGVGAEVDLRIEAEFKKAK